MTTKHKTKDMTKAELVRAIQAKVRKASPIIRRGAFSTKDLMRLKKSDQAKVRKASPIIRRGAFSTKDLMRLKKSELQRQLRKARVVTSGHFKGDVEFF